MNEDLFKALLPNQADLTLFTLVVSGEKNPLQQFCLQHAVREIPGAALPATPPKPAWDLTEGICGMKILQKPSGLSILGWIAALLLKHTANSYLTGSCCSYSHLVFSRDLLVTIYCGLDNTCVFTGMPFYFQLVYPSCPSIFHSLNKVSWFSGRRCHVKRC